MKWNNTLNNEVWGSDGSKIAVANNKANARLIAAAPELLEACKEVHRLMAYPVLTHSTFDRIRDILKQAITKAQGKE